MTSSRRLGCAAVLLVAGLVPAMSSSAQADSAVVVDAPGDVAATTFGPRRATTKPAPDDTQRDVLGIDFDYEKRFIVAVAQLCEVRGKGKNVDVRLRLKGGGVDSEFSRLSGGRLRQVGVGVEGGLTCRGGTFAVDPVSATARIRVPARCMGTPDRLRFGLSSLGVTGVTRDDTFVLLTDDARTDGRSSGGFAPARLGAPVRHG